MEQAILDLAKSWAENTDFDADFRGEIQALIDTNDTTELTDRFYKDLEFGTGGLRGILGAGANRINLYTIRRATAGLGEYIASLGIENPSVVIGYDCRNFSQEFSVECSRVLVALGIKVYRFVSLRPTPEISFSVRNLKATAGIIITASHNPKEYNGYKVSWSDGCQVTPPHDVGIIERVNAIHEFGSIQVANYDQALKDGMVVELGLEQDEKYYSRCMDLFDGDMTNNKNFGVMFTPLHGTGNLPVRELLKRRGFEAAEVVEAQTIADGNFPTLVSPNPEEPSALEMAVAKSGPNVKLIMATDPDADRLGAMVRVGDKFEKLNGNQIGQLLFEHYLRNLEKSGKMPDKGVYITTIVTSKLGAKIAAKKGVVCYEVLTGFKYIGEIMRGLDDDPSSTFLFGTEESHGYLFGDFVRDKDGCTAAVILAELAAELDAEGKTLFDRLEEIHQTYGYHHDLLINKVIKGKEGADQINRIMAELRSNPPNEIGGVEVVGIRDYGEKKIYEKGEFKGETNLPASNVLAFYLADGSRITARPSGTEPKIKFYFNLEGTNPVKLKSQTESYEQDFMKRINQIP